MAGRSVFDAGGIISLTSDRFSEQPSAATQPRESGGSSSRSKWLDAFPTEAAAQTEAINELKVKLVHREQLARVRHIKADYEKRKALVQAQLSSAVRTQVDTTRLGLDLISESVTMVTEVRNNFKHVDEACKTCKAQLKDNGEIDDVNCVRTNLIATNSLLETFEKMPARASTLIVALQDDEQAIKQVYKDLRKLVRLRDTAYEQGISFSEDFKQSLKKLDSKLSEATTALQQIVFKNIADLDILAEDDPSVLIRTVEVIEMDDRARRPLFRGIDALDDNKGMSGEAISIADGRVKPKQLIQASNPAKKGLSMREKCFQELELVLQETFSELLQATKERPQGKPGTFPIVVVSSPAAVVSPGPAAAESAVDALPSDIEDAEDRLDSQSESSRAQQRTSKSGVEKEEETKEESEETLVERLEAMLELLAELPDLEEAIAPCFPEDWKIVEFYETRYRHNLHVAIKWHTSEPAKLPKRDLLKTVAFLQDYIKKMPEYYPNVPPIQAQNQELLSRCGMLMGQYLKATKGTILHLVNNMIALELRNPALNEDEDGAFSTTGPRDLFNIVNQQIDIVIEGGVSGQGLADVVFMFAEVFTHHMGALMDYLTTVEMRGEQLLFGPQHELKEEPFFLAQINNCQQCEEYMNELKEKIEEFLELEEDESDGEGEEEEDSGGERVRRKRRGGSAVAGVRTGGLKARSPVEAEGDEEETMVDKIGDSLDDCSGGYIDVAKQCIEILVMKFMTVMQPNLDLLFTPSWMQRESEPMESLVAGLGEFFDFVKLKRVWSQKIAVKLMSQIVQLYLHRFVEIKPVVSPQLFERLKEDRSVLRRFFDNHKDLVSEKDLKAEIGTLKIIREVVYAEEGFIEVHFQKIIDKFGSEALEVMDGLLAVRADLSAKTRKDIMASFCEKLPFQNNKGPEVEERKASVPHQTAASSKRLWSNFKGRLGSKKAMPKRPASLPGAAGGGGAPARKPSLLVRMNSKASLTQGTDQSRKSGSLPGLSES
eukprot:gb/GEZN01001241.1/.p1 GENE.gb/GEZN01001241.1/~~gb/GEZN01001241.1/.p1  ORF type:complete len:1001 (-),score=247.07 gb/GEZN01001241.1/:140-3142(-)